MPRPIKAAVVALVGLGVLLAVPSQTTAADARSVGGTITLRVPEIVALRTVSSVRIQLTAGGFSATARDTERALGGSATAAEMQVAVFLTDSMLHRRTPVEARLANAFSVWSLSPSGSTRLSVRIESRDAVGAGDSRVSLSGAAVQIAGRLGTTVSLPAPGLGHATNGDLVLRIDASAASAPGWHHGGRIRLVLENI